MSYTIHQPHRPFVLLKMGHGQGSILVGMSVASLSDDHAVLHQQSYATTRSFFWMVLVKWKLLRHSAVLGPTTLSVLHCVSPSHLASTVFTSLLSGF